MKTIKFRGTVSGDGESFCFDVNKETFISVTQREPELWCDYQAGKITEIGGVSTFTPEDPDKCRLYPDHLFGFEEEEIEVEIKMK